MPLAVCLTANHENVISGKKDANIEIVMFQFFQYNYFTA